MLITKCRIYRAEAVPEWALFIFISLLIVLFMEKFHQKEEHYKLIFHSASMLKSFKKIHIEFSSLLDSPEI